MRRLIALFVIVGVVALGSCRDDGILSPELLGPQHSILDAAHGVDGNPHFWWLPPMVPQPSPEGIFNPNANPRVEICELDLNPTDPVEANTPCAGGPPFAEFTLTSGVGAVITVESDHYKLEWHTDLFDVEAAVDNVPTYRVQVFVGAHRLGFADIQFGDNAREVRNLSVADEIIGLVDGRTLPLRFRIEQGAVAFATEEECVGDCTETAIDAEDGGTASAETDDGEVVAVVPAGAADEDFVVVIDVQPGSQLEPEAQGFAFFAPFFDIRTVPEIPEWNEPVIVCIFQDIEIGEAATVIAAPGPGGVGIRILTQLPEVPAECAPPTLGAANDGFLARLASSGRWGEGLAKVVTLGRWAAPRPLHATALVLGHGGLTGLDGSFGFSPREPLDPASGGVQDLAFLATFTDDIVDQPPTAPEVGYWSLPTSGDVDRVRVRAAAGTLPNPPVVTVSGAATLIGTVLGEPPSTGLYLARWRSVVIEGEPEAEIVLRGGTGLAISRVGYEAAGGITYNDEATGLLWDENEPQLFEVVVDLDDHVSTLLVDGVAVPSAERVPFLQAAQDLAGLRVTGAQEGTALALDDFEVTRRELRVCQTEADAFNEVAHAVASAAPGATVSLCDGTYVAEDVLIQKPLTITADPGTAPTVVNGDAPVSFRINGVSEGTVRFSDLRFETDTIVSIFAAQTWDRIEIQGSEFVQHSPNGRGVQIQGSSVATAHAEILGSTFTGGTVGVFSLVGLAGVGPQFDVLNSTFTTQGFSGIQYQAGSRGRIEGNVLSECGVNGCIRALAIDSVHIKGNVMTVESDRQVDWGIAADGGVHVIEDNTVTGDSLGAIPGAGIRVGRVPRPQAGIPMRGNAVVLGNTITNANAGIEAVDADVVGHDNVIDGVGLGIGAFETDGSVGPGPEGSAVTINGSDITNYVTPMDGPGLVDLECNWWGDAGGPQNVPFGVPAAVYTPWATGPVAAGAGGACDGGL